MSPIPALTRRLVALVGAVVAAVALALAAAPAASAVPGHDDVSTVQPLYGGMTMTGTGGSSCVTGYNVHSGSTYYIVVSGQCAEAGTDWSIGGVHVGTTVGFPSSPAYGLVSVDTANWQPQGAILVGGAVHPITGPGQPVVGGSVCSADQRTGVHCGTVTGLNVSVSFPEGTINGLAQTNMCMEAGSGGAPVYSGSAAEGILLGGSGNCSSGGQSFFMPIVEILSETGLSLV